MIGNVASGHLDQNGVDLIKLFLGNVVPNLEGKNAVHRGLVVVPAELAVDLAGACELGLIHSRT